MKKVIIAGVGAVMLLGGGFYGMKSVSAAENPTNAAVSTQTSTAHHVGKRFTILSQYKEQIHQINQLREERLDLKKQMVEKRDQLLDLFLAAKNSGNKDKLKQAKAVKQQFKSINGEMKNLNQDAKDQRKALKEALKNGTENGQFEKLLSTNQQINEKMKAKVSELDKLIDALK
jgi:hypothetical protein